jgi:hypothetical protein
MVRNQVQIENPKRLPLAAEVEGILRRTFAAHQRVVIKAELGSGFSGSRVLLAHPIRDAPELPVVIKIAPVSLIEREYQAYQKHIRNKLSGAAEITNEPISLPGSDWAGLCYHLVGSGIFEIESLNSFCRHASVKDIWHVLEKRLFRRIAPLWQFSHTSPQFNLQASYDRLLPVNLLLGPTSLPPGALYHLLSPDATPDHAFKQGDYVRLEGFVVTEIDPHDRSATLNLPTSSDGMPVSYRLRLQPVDVPPPYQVNDVIDTVEGVVTATRDDLLRAYARRALGLDYAEVVTARTLTLPGDSDTVLPNPLAVLRDMLGESRHVRIACIHGDLNMENILVVPDTRDVSLIDFAMARQDHVLHDLLRLETGVVTWLLPEALAEAQLPPETIHRLYEQLHCATHPSGYVSVPERLHPALTKALVMLATIRNMARGCLFAADDWGEYYQGLTLYLLGALKFKNLDHMQQAPLPKQVAFWGAASAQYLLREQPFLEGTVWQPLTSIIHDRTGQTLEQYEIGERIGKGSMSVGPVARQRAHPSVVPAFSSELPPFIAGPPITHPRQFFGRERELRRLLNLWKRTPLQNAAIIGPRRSGKTSLLLYLKSITTTPPSELRAGQRADWLPEPERYHWIFVDFQDSRMSSRQELLGYLLAHLNLSAADAETGSRRAPCDLDHFMDVVSRGLHTPTIILLDEIDVALQRYPELDTVFWESLRSLATNHVGGNLAFALAAYESPGLLASYSHIGSPFFNIFGYTATLGPLTEQEARELIASSPIPFPPVDVDWILSRSGRWPMLLQILCRERLVALEDGEADDVWQEDGLRQIAPFRDAFP